MSVAVGSGRRGESARGSATVPVTSRKTDDSARRRAPLLPALIFTIILTQLPFVATLVISFMDWNAYYPDERSFAGFALKSWSPSTGNASQGSAERGRIPMMMSFRVMFPITA